MPWNGLGTYAPPGASFPEYTGNLVDATRYNAVINDLASGITASLARDGQNTPTANLPMGGYRHTGAAPALADGQYVVLEQLDGTFSQIPRRTSGWVTGECLAVSAGVTLNTSDLAAGYTFSLYNDSGSSITLTQGSGVTLRLSGTGTTGNRTLAARGLATIWCNSSTEAVVIGAGVS